MKDWGHMKFENESEIACWNTFQAKYSVTHGNCITIIIMLIHWSTPINSFHQLLYCEFAVILNKLKHWGHMKFEKHEWNCKLKHLHGKHSVTLGNWITIIIMLIHLYTSINSFQTFRTMNLQFTLNKMKSWGHMT